MSEKSILIATSSNDSHAYVPVGEALESQGYTPIIYKSDKVIQGEESFSLLVNEDGMLDITYQGVHIEPDRIGAAWYRKPGAFAPPDSEIDLAKQQYMNNEVRSLHGTIWPLYDEQKWLNSPGHIVRGEQKLRQLIVASKMGFSILNTLVTNDWDSVRELQGDDQKILAIKMIRGVLAENNQLKGMHTTPLSPQEVERLSTSTVPFPGLIQPFASKLREWRVTVVGEDVFSASIYTDFTAKDDWRRHQTSSAVEFRSEAIDDETSEKCVRYLAAMGLGYGAFDFIETNDSELIFLECNPNGQYGWLEEDLGFPISNSIASHLIAIAHT